MNGELLCCLLNIAGFDGAAASSRIISKFGSFAGALEADQASLCEACGSKPVAAYIKLLAALSSRRVSDRFSFGKKHTDAEIEEYFKSVFFAIPVETVYVMSFDKAGRAIACDKAGEGIVNGTNVLPRRIVEIAKLAGACSVILAHNHPNGYAIASDDDVAGSIVLREILFAAGINLAAHYVVAGADAVKIEI